MGDSMLRYWEFFPAEEGWGRVPVWGFATVAEGRAEGVAAGARVWGYLPIEPSFDVVPARARADGFMDASPHRQGKARVYNYYAFTHADPVYDAAYEPEQTLFRPLYATGWLAADCIAQTQPRPVAAVLTSASSKTALATAHQLKRLGGIETIALTAARNRAFVEGTGLYDLVCAYPDVATLAGRRGPIVMADYLGNPEIAAAAHAALGAALTRSLAIGATDWIGAAGLGAGPSPPAPGPKREFFFVPDYRDARVKEDPALPERLNADMRAFYAPSGAYVQPQRIVGAQAIAATWARLVRGDIGPAEGIVASF
jgi:hypothetical protein